MRESQTQTRLSNKKNKTRRRQMSRNINTNQSSLKERNINIKECLFQKVAMNRVS